MAFYVCMKKKQGVTGAYTGARSSQRVFFMFFGDLDYFCALSPRPLSHSPSAVGGWGGLEVVYVRVFRYL